MELRFARSAIDDLQAIQIYYKEQGVPQIGEQFVRAILDHSTMLSQHPDVGRLVPEFNQANIRELIHPPFRIVYLRQVTELIIIRVWRGERLLELPTEML
ncbi:type II toxin-antitoxin system RelE/ParE family toxin [Methylophaga sp.]|uniref:type II toxin-antitoxin system RelE/ParE family toxin n=1 Tax=Methylophaga sp. TaxID=2024840 RepID=UPI003A93B675